MRAPTAPLLAPAALLLLAAVAAAQDRKPAAEKPAPEQFRDEVLVVNPKGPPSRVTGVEILSETYEKVEFKSKAGSVASKSASEVVGVKYGDVPDFYRAGVEAWKAGRFADAEQEFLGAKSAVLAGKARKWVDHRADAYIADCRRRLAADSKSPAAQYAEAAILYSKALEAEPKSPLADLLLLGRAEALSLSGKPDDALQALDALAKAAREARIPLWEARARQSRGRLMERRGESLSAANEYGDLAEFLAKEAVGAADAETKRALEALRVDALVRRGWALMARAEQTKNAADLDAARGWFDRVTAQTGGAAAAKAAAANGAGVAALLGGDPRAAIPKFLEVEVTRFEVPEEVARALWYKAKSYEALGDARRREEALKDLVEFYPWSEWANRAR